MEVQAAQDIQDIQQVEMPDPVAMIRNMSIVYNTYFKNKDKDENLITSFLSGKYLTATCDETEKQFKVTNPGRWVSFNNTKIEFLSTGTFKKAETYVAIQKTNLGAPVDNLESIHRFMPIDVFESLSNLGMINTTLGRLLGYTPVVGKDFNGTHPAYREELYALIRKIDQPKEKDAVPAPEFGKHFLFQNRYITYITDISRGQTYTMNKINGELGLESKWSVFGWGNTKLWTEHINKISVNIAATVSAITIIYLDTYNWNIVSPQESAKLTAIFIKSPEFDVIVEAIPNLKASLELLKMDGVAFANKLNTYFAENGWPNLKCTTATPEIVHKQYTKYDFTKDSGAWGSIAVTDSIAAYKCEITYGGKDIISNKTGGWVYVADDDNLTMVRSAWCQRTTRWSKETANIIDQLDQWNFLDWLTGPFFEKIEMKPKEAAFVFKGRESNKEVRKAAAMQALRNALG